MNDKQLVQELINQKFLSEKDGESVLRDAVTFGKTAEEILNSRGSVSERELAGAKSKIIGIPVATVNLKNITDEILAMVPEETAKTYQVIPIAKEGETLIIGMVHPEDEKTQEVLRYLGRQQKLNIGAYLITLSDLNLVLRRYSPFQSAYTEALRSMNLSDKKATSGAKLVELEAKARDNEEAPIIKIVAALLREAVNSGASDVHIEPQRNNLRVRFRVNGELQEISNMPAELHQPILSRVKIMSDLKIDETRIPQDGRFRTSIYGKEIDFRVATFPTPRGEKVAIRVLDPETGLKSLDQLGIVGRNLKLITESVKRPYGLILLTGPTGSGKTTTLYALLQLMNKIGVNIVSLEDPVEYSIDGLNQSQVHPEINYDFASGLRQILRQDPDVIMVGEIRDTETAELAVHAALTGHIVLSTLHTNNSLTVVPRLIDLKVQPFLIPNALDLMIGQRLIPKLCEKCRKEKEASPAVSEAIEKEIIHMPKELVGNYKKPFKVFSSPGCEVCKGKGIVGRIAIYEVFKMTPQLADIISAGISETKIAAEATRQGMITLRQDGVLKALQGITAIEEVIRETESGFGEE